MSVWHASTGLLPVLPRSITWPPDIAAYRDTVARLDQAGLPVVDHCRGTLPVAPDALAAGWRKMLGELPDGITHFALHATVPGEFEVVAPDHAIWRSAEYGLLVSGSVATALAESGVTAGDYRAMQLRWAALSA